MNVWISWYPKNRFHKVSYGTEKYERKKFSQGKNGRCLFISAQCASIKSKSLSVQYSVFLLWTARCHCFRFDHPFCFVFFFWCVSCANYFGPSWFSFRSFLMATGRETVENKSHWRLTRCVSNRILRLRLFKMEWPRYESVASVYSK